MQKNFPFVAILIVLLLQCCATAATAAPVSEDLAKLKGKIMSADYRADLEELGRLRDEAARFGDDRELGYLAHYWSGFASWRIAINGANHGMKADDLKKHLRTAATAFYASMKRKHDFADAYAAAAGVNSWLPVFDMGPSGDEVAVKERVYLAFALLDRASALDPKNPRVLWIEGGLYLFRPPSMGGDIPRAIRIYEEMLKESDRRGTNASSPLPDWGKPEALMSLAFAHSKKSPADLAAAIDDAIREAFW